MELKAIRLFPMIESNEDFIFKPHPVLNPAGLEYKNYWDDMEKKCIEGLWGRDGSKWRYMSGPLHFYIKLGAIDRIMRGKAGQGTGSPNLRDIEWIVSYDYLICRGFSGFRDDPYYTCQRIIGRLQAGEELDVQDQYELEELQHVKRPDGSYKTYIDPIELLHNKSDLPLGPPLYENDALNYNLMGARGVGKSYLIANMVILHEWLFDGVKYYEDLEDMKMKSVTVVGSGVAAFSEDLLSKVRVTMMKLEQEHGAWEEDDTVKPGFFDRKYTGTFEPGKSITARYQKKTRTGFVYKGSHSLLAHRVFTVESPQAAVGKRANIIICEEVGLVKNILQVHGSNKNVMSVDGKKFGTAIYLGTGGNMEKITGIKAIFENPDTYDMFCLKDVFEGRSKPIGRFIPAYYGLMLDNLGNTILDDSYQSVMDRRRKLSQNETSDALDDEMMNSPIFPSEMFMSKAGLKFPAAKIRARKADLDIHKLHERIWSKGWLEYEDKEKKSVRWVPDIENRIIPILTYNLDQYKLNYTSGIVIYEHPPEYIPDPTFRRSLYKVTYDTLKDDHGGTSLASIIVYKGFPDNLWEGGFTDTIVAEYIGRLDKVNDIHEIAIKLAMYYNAKLLPEINIPDIVRYCEMQGKFYLLQPAPEVAIGKFVKNPTFKYKVGIDMTSGNLQEQSIQLLRQWLLNPREKDANGVVTKTNIDFIYSLRLLNELEVYNGEGNYDHLRSAMILALWLAQETEEPIKLANENAKYEEIETYFAEKHKQINNEFYYNF